MIEYLIAHPLVDALAVFLAGLPFAVAAKIVVDRTAEKVDEVLVDPFLESALALVHSEDWWAVFDDLRSLNPDKSYRHIVRASSLILEMPLLSAEGWERFVDEVKEVDKV